MWNIKILPSKDKFCDLETSSWQRNNTVLFSFSAPFFFHRYLVEIRSLGGEGGVGLNSQGQSFCFISASVHLTEQVKDVKSKQEIQYYLYIPLHFSSQQDLSLLAGDDGKIHCCLCFPSLLSVSALSVAYKHHDRNCTKQNFPKRKKKLCKWIILFSLKWESHRTILHPHIK